MALLPNFEYVVLVSVHFVATLKAFQSLVMNKKKLSLISKHF